MSGERLLLLFDVFLQIRLKPRVSFGSAAKPFSKDCTDYREAHRMTIGTKIWTIRQACKLFESLISYWRSEQKSLLAVTFHISRTSLVTVFGIKHSSNKYPL